MYFNYHAKIKNLIKQKHAVGFEYVKDYHNITPCMLIYFDDGKIFPIRQSHFAEYEILLSKFDVKKFD